MVNIEGYLNGLLALTSDPAPLVRKRVCSGFLNLLEIRAELLKPYMSGLISYMIETTQDPTEFLAIEACEFWSSLGDLPGICRDVLPPFLPQ